MLFNSYIFILAFLPLCILGYFLLNRICSNNYSVGMVFILLMSLWFYSYDNIGFLWILLISIGFNYGIYLALNRVKKKAIRKMLLVSAILVNVGIIFYYKYFNFVGENVSLLLNLDFVRREIFLPLGISFFTFQQISFIVDAYRKEVPEYKFIDYACFVSFFPQLVAGPIVSHDEIIPQFMDATKKGFVWENFSKGAYLFVLGLAKKVLLADTFGNAVNFGYDNIPELNSTSAIVVMISYTMQIYFDFSGYCDMAMGISKMLNIDLPINFHSPYKAITIEDFWKRWHMTLTRFLTKYVYIPLGGNRKGNVRTYINVFVVFLVSGIWHGANWTFIIWGIFHGIFMVITRLFKKFFDKIPKVINWAITFSFINITWIFFRANTIDEALEFIAKIFSLEFGNVGTEIIDCFNLLEIQTIMGKLHLYGICEIFPPFLLCVFLTVAAYWAIVSKNAYEKMQSFKPTVLKAFTTAFLLGWCIFSFAGISTFLYFNF